MIIHALVAVSIITFIFFHNIVFLNRRKELKAVSSSFVRIVIYIPVFLLIATMLIRRGWPLFGELAAVLSLMQFGVSRVDWAAKKGEPHLIPYPTALLYLCFILVFVLGWLRVVDMFWVVVPVLAAAVLVSYYETFISSKWWKDTTERRDASKKVETRKEESVKVTGAQVTEPAQTSDAERMQDLYQRILVYMEEKKPYLDEDLQMDKLAAAVYTNKTYLSRTINVMSGRNFCQFVNYYRIMYAVQIMERDRRVKVSELAMLVGFHTVVSFNMAFKLYMNTTPTEYLRTLQAKSLEERRS